MSELVIDIQYSPRRTGWWQDTDKRSEHVLTRMQQRGIGVQQIKDAIARGAKRRMEDGCIISEFRWFRIVYREFVLGDLRKIYPITVEVI